MGAKDDSFDVFMTAVQQTNLLEIPGVPSYGMQSVKALDRLENIRRRRHKTNRNQYLPGDLMSLLPFARACHVDGSP
jgi:hypothetical protein